MLSALRSQSGKKICAAGLRNVNRAVFALVDGSSSTGAYRARPRGFAATKSSRLSRTHIGAPVTASKSAATWVSRSVQPACSAAIVAVWDRRPGQDRRDDRFRPRLAEAPELG